MHTWEFVLENKSHIIQLLDSLISSQKKISLDNNTLIIERNYNENFSYQFGLGSHKIEIIQIAQNNYHLKIDGINFNQLMKEPIKKNINNDLLNNDEILQIKKKLDGNNFYDLEKKITGEEKIVNNEKEKKESLNFENNMLMKNNNLNNYLNNMNSDMNNNNFKNTINSQFNNNIYNNNMNNNMISYSNINDNTNVNLNMRNNLTNNNINNDKKEELEIKIKELENEIKLFREYCHLSANEKLILLNFISTDQKIDFSIVGKNTDDFIIYEKKLYEKYPNYKDTENYFLVNGKKINRNRTLEENNIKNEDKMILNIIDD